MNDVRACVRSCSGLSAPHGSRVSCNRQNPPRVEKADGHAASPEWPRATRGLARVSPGFLRRAPGVTFQGLGWFLRSRPLEIQGDAVDRPGVSASGFQAARVGSIRVRFATVSRDGRIRETDDNVLDRQGIHPAPSGSATKVRGPGPLHRPRGERERHPVTTRSRPVRSDRAAQPLKRGLVQR